MDNTPAPLITVSPQAAPTAVSWDASYRLPDAGTDYLYFTVPDNFTVTNVRATLLNFRHYRASDVVVGLMRPNDPATEVLLINRPCNWIATGNKQTTFGSVRAISYTQVNASFPGDVYYFSDTPAQGSIQGAVCPINEAGINPIPGGVSGTYQPMDPNFPGYLGLAQLVNGIWLGNLPGSMRLLAGASAQGVWTMRFTDAAVNYAGWISGAVLTLDGIGSDGTGAARLQARRDVAALC